MSRVIALDSDGVLSDFVHGVLEWTQARGMTNTKDDITDFNIFKAFGRPDLWVPFGQSCSEPGWVLGLPVIDGAKEFVGELRELGEVVVVTSPYKGAPFWMNERNEWLHAHFGFEQKDIIHATHKHLIRADVLIDDAAHNVETFPGPAVLIDSPWNRQCKAGIRAKSFGEAIEAVKGILG